MSASPKADADAQSTTDKRTQKARQEDIQVEGHTRLGDSHVLSVSNDDDTDRYDVMVSTDAPVATGCSCGDDTFRNPDGGCKHRRAVGDLLGVVEPLAGDDYVDDAQIRSMVDAPVRSVNAALAVVSDD